MSVFDFEFFYLLCFSKYEHIVIGIIYNTYTVILAINHNIIIY